ncbi:hypothetical protein ACFQY0_01060 [Haloferula chungangensis]|uniref:Uncharacterized protein n=1 Tax=Haloferula chungangensis TaxID=1048331 RepID=A0ABW2L0D3_9BACT
MRTKTKAAKAKHAGIKEIESGTIRYEIVKPSVAFKLDVPVSLLKALWGVSLSRCISRVCPKDMDDLPYRKRNWNRPFRTTGCYIAPKSKLIEKLDPNEKTDDWRIEIQEPCFTASEAMAKELGIELRDVFLAALAYTVEVNKSEGRKS